jgi:pentapeptide MXKDX repeat protein
MGNRCRGWAWVRPEANHPLGDEQRRFNVRKVWQVIAVTVVSLGLGLAIGGCGSPTTTGKDKMGGDKMGSDRMGGDKMQEDKMGSDKMGGDKMQGDKMGGNKMGADKMKDDKKDSK